MPKWQNIIKLISIFLICNFILACGNNTEKNTEDKWAFITKEINVTLSSDNPDSVKIYQIKKIFEKYQIGIEEYQIFYNEHIKENPIKSTRLLKVVEHQLSEDLKNISKENRKKIEDYKRGLKKNNTD